MTQKGAKQLKLVGIISIIFGVITMFLSTGAYENSYSYGGDAYTGIQNAAAQTANNVQSVGGSIKFGLAALLIVIGLVLFVVGRNLVTAAAAAATVTATATATPVGYAQPTATATTAYAQPTATATTYAQPTATAATAYAQPTAATYAQPAAQQPTYSNTTNYTV